MKVDRFFLPEAADRQRLPVALLSGFLGSGKTTLLNGILRDPRMADTAVAINEFGAVPIDQHLIDHGAEDTVVLANGCLCCTVQGDLEGAILRLFSRRGAGELPHFARLVIEPSGLADPAPLAGAILRKPGLSRVLRLDGIYTVVDALFGAQQLHEHDEAVTQVALASRVVLSKTDLAAERDVRALRSRLERLNPTAPVLTVRNGQIDPAALFTPHFLDPLAPHPPDLSLLRAMAIPAHGGDLRATVLEADTPLPWRDLDEWLRRKRLGLAEHLMRLKGIVHVAGSERPVVLQGVRHVMHPPVSLHRWPDDDRRTRLVLITRGLDNATVRDGWDALRATR